MFSFMMSQEFIFEALFSFVKVRFDITRPHIFVYVVLVLEGICPLATGHC